MAENIQQTQSKTFEKVTGWLVPVFTNRMAAIVIFTLGLGLVVYLTLFNKQSQWIEIATSRKEIREIALPDGSKVWLNKGSTLRYGKELQSVAQREVWLEGEAYFEVVHKPQQPFVVHAAGAVTQVLGTSFNMRSYPDESTVAVDVLTGKVNFKLMANESSESLVLETGNGAILDKKKVILQKKEEG